jgi:prephenate dehydrogenase
VAWSKPNGAFPSYKGRVTHPDDDLPPPDVVNTVHPDGAAPLRPRTVERVAIIGLGLVGGSIAKATRAAFPRVHLTGIDKQGIVDVAVEHAIVDDGLELEHAHDALRRADLVILSLPVLAIAETLASLADVLRDGPVITDTGSTKGVIDVAAQALDLKRFVGSHPMAGKSQGGLAHADALLFNGATWFLCPGPHTEPAATQRLRTFVRTLGAKPVEIDPAEHDRDVALTSHVPHVVANAIAELVLEDSALESAGGSLRDLLLIAGAPAETWADTLSTNQVAVRAVLTRLSARLMQLADELDDKERVKVLFGRGRACRERVRSGG